MSVSLDRRASTWSRSRPVLTAAWPVVLGLAGGALVWGMDVASAAQLMPVLPLLYVATFSLRRRGATWPLWGLSFVYVVLLQLQSVVGLGVGLAVAAVAFAAWGLVRAVRGELEWKELALQYAALVTWLTLAFAGASTAGSAPGVARVVVAVGWIGHGVWDLWHLRRDAVVSRSFAVWCAVFDAILGVSVLVAP